LRVERHLEMPVEELLDWAYRLGSGDPWAGYLGIKEVTGEGLAGVRDQSAVIRHRLSTRSGS